MTLRHILCVAAILGGYTAGAQLRPTAHVDVETRLGYYNYSIDGDALHDRNGFKCDYLNVALSGDIIPQVSYFWRQRINKHIPSDDVLAATDMLYAEYRPSDQWQFTAGKQALAVGTYEYNRAPIDIYTASEFWGSLPCYQFAVQATYKVNHGNDAFTFQFSESPFRTPEYNDIYAYHLMWVSHHGPVSTLYSVNLIEWRPSHYISYLALGHSFSLGRATFELDLINRAAAHQTFLFRNCTISADCSLVCHKRLNAFAKFTYDVNHTNTPADLTVLPGTEITTWGAGVEYFPFDAAGHNLRLNACINYAHGHNADPSADFLSNLLRINIGLTYKLKLL